MINKDKLEEVLADVRMIVLHRIMLLSDASKVIDDIEIARLYNGSDEYIMASIRNGLARRKTIVDLDKKWDEDERKVWEKLLLIDQSEWEES